MKYWIKPIGSSDAPVAKNEKFNFREEITFSSKPSGIKIGDILIVYAVKHKVLISAFKVLSEPIKSSEDELAQSPNWRRKYKWALYAENLNKKFSNFWVSNNLDLYDLETSFKNLSTERVTNTPSNSLNGLKQQNSYIELSKAFSLFMIEKMSKIKK